MLYVETQALEKSSTRNPQDGKHARQNCLGSLRDSMTATFCVKIPNGPEQSAGQKNGHTERPRLASAATGADGVDGADPAAASMLKICSYAPEHNRKGKIGLSEFHRI